MQAQHHCFRALIVTAIAGVTALAHAAPHEVTFHGRVAENFGSFISGEAFDATLLFDPAQPLPDLFPSNTDWGVYDNSIVNTTVTIGGTTWTQKEGGLARLQIASDTGNTLLVFSVELSGPSLSGTPVDVFTLHGRSLHSFTTDAIPQGPSSAADFEYVIGSVNFGSKGAAVGWAKWSPSPYTDTTFQISPVPEPSTLSLLGIGLLAVIGAGNRATRKKLDDGPAASLPSFKQ